MGTELNIECVFEVGNSWDTVFIGKYEDKIEFNKIVRRVESNYSSDISNITYGEDSVNFNLQHTIIDVSCSDEGMYVCGIAVGNITTFHNVKVRNVSVSVSGI